MLQACNESIAREVTRSGNVTFANVSISEWPSGNLSSHAEDGAKYVLRTDVVYELEK